MVSIDDGLKAVMVKVLYDNIPAEQREKMLQDALASLMTQPPKGSSVYDKQEPAPIIRIFTDCVYQVARKVITEHMEKDDKLKKEIESLYAAALARVCIEDRENTISKMASALSDAMANLKQ